MSYNRSRIAGSIRSRLAADLTGARDLTGSPFPVSAEGLPAYAVKLQPVSTQTASMGSRDFIVEDRASIFAWAVGDQGTDAALWAFADELSEIVYRAPLDLGGLVERMVPAGAEVQAFPAAARVWGLQFSIDLLYIETPSPAIEAADFSAGFSLGFRA
jgi:hypothetical protein